MKFQQLSGPPPGIFSSYCKKILAIIHLTKKVMIVLQNSDLVEGVELLGVLIALSVSSILVHVLLCPCLFAAYNYSSRNRVL